MATTEASTESEPQADVDDFPPHRMTIDRYLRLVEAGVYDANDPVFLWQGRLVEKMNKGRPHVIAAVTLNRLLTDLVPEGHHVEHEAPVAIGDDSMPEPDLAIIRGSLRDYRVRHPTAGDVSLVVEVSDSTLKGDSGTKLRAYASRGIPVYWIVNIPMGRIEVYGLPEGPSYREHRDYGPDDEVPVVLDGPEVGRIAAREVLP